MKIPFSSVRTQHAAKYGLVGVASIGMAFLVVKTVPVAMEAPAAVDDFPTVADLGNIDTTAVPSITVGDITLNTFATSANARLGDLAADDDHTARVTMMSVPDPFSQPFIGSTPSAQPSDFDELVRAGQFANQTSDASGYIDASSPAQATPGLAAGGQASAGAGGRLGLGGNAGSGGRVELATSGVGFNANLNLKSSGAEGDRAIQDENLTVHHAIDADDKWMVASIPDSIVGAAARDDASVRAPFDTEDNRSAISGPGTDRSDVASSVPARDLPTDAIQKGNVVERTRVVTVPDSGGTLMLLGAAMIALFSQRRRF